MANPLIVIVDDRPRGLAALHDAVARRYGNDYDVAAFLSGDEALTALAHARDRGDEVALIIADQFMPGMTGSEVLQRAHHLHPGAQRALLVSWGDTRANETILQGCARGVLDNYVLKPWAPAEVHLYPLIGEFLAEWTRTHRPRLELIRVISEQPSRRGGELRDLLERNSIPGATARAGCSKKRASIPSACSCPFWSCSTGACSRTRRTRSSPMRSAYPAWTSARATSRSSARARAALPAR